MYTCMWTHASTMPPQLQLRLLQLTHISLRAYYQTTMSWLHGPVSHVQ